MRPAELARRLRVKPDERRAFTDLLRQMEVDGLIVEVKNKRLALPDKVNLVVGTLRVHPRGFGFVLPKGSQLSGDVFVAEGEMGTAVDQDIVAVRLHRPEPQAGPAGKVVSVIQRGREQIVGTFRTTKRFALCVPDDPRVVHNIYIGPGEAKGAQPGEKVVVKITEWPSRHSAPEGRVIEVLGPLGDQKVDTLSIVRGFGLPDTFGSGALAEARGLGRKVDDRLGAGRRDLTGRLTVTIDPADAKDFDDAFSLERDGGRWRLAVHIADVSAYVKEGSNLDREARLRGTSVYLPGTVIPMLPEALSNGLCSLKPRQLRLTKTVELVYDKAARLLDVAICRSAIRSKHRLNYAEALDVIEGGSHGDRKLDTLLTNAHALAQKLRDGRRQRGILELDVPKPAVRLDPFGDVAEVHLERTDAAHDLIEEFMLAANEAVAQLLCKQKLPGIFRVHPEPEADALDEFARIARALGLRPSGTHRKALQKLLDKARTRPDGRLIHLALLRTLPHAVYTHQPGEHFALATSRYLHFTSPIRRYPDLVVHRVLDDYFDGRLKSMKQRRRYAEQFAACAQQCSYTEQRAEDAERELINLKILEFLGAHRRRIYEGIIAGVKEQGVLVDLDELGIYGFVRLSSLTDDFYQIDSDRLAVKGRATARRLRLGQRVRVRLTELDMLKRRADFTIVE